MTTCVLKCRTVQRISFIPVHFNLFEDANRLKKIQSTIQLARQLPIMTTKKVESKSSTRPHVHLEATMFTLVTIAILHVVHFENGFSSPLSVGAPVLAYSLETSREQDDDRTAWTPPRWYNRELGLQTA